jgi:hypothetical protein
MSEHHITFFTLFGPGNEKRGLFRLRPIGGAFSDPSD